MVDLLNKIKKTYTGKLALLLSLVTCAFWIGGNAFSVYAIPVVGGIFELLWVPMVILLFAVPIISSLITIANKFNSSSFYLASIALTVCTALWVM